MWYFILSREIATNVLYTICCDLFKYHLTLQLSNTDANKAVSWATLQCNVFKNDWQWSNKFTTRATVHPDNWIPALLNLMGYVSITSNVNCLHVMIKQKLLLSSLPCFSFLFLIGITYMCIYIYLDKICDAYKIHYERWYIRRPDFGLIVQLYDYWLM